MRKPRIRSSIIVQVDQTLDRSAGCRTGQMTFDLACPNHTFKRRAQGGPTRKEHVEREAFIPGVAHVIAHGVAYTGDRRVLQPSTGFNGLCPCLVEASSPAGLSEESCHSIIHRAALICNPDSLATLTNEDSLTLSNQIIKHTFALSGELLVFAPNTSSRELTFYSGSQLLLI